MSEEKQVDVGYEEDIDEEELAMEALGRLTILAEKQIEAEDYITELENKIKEKKKFLLKISQDLLPTLMQELRFTDFGLEDGSRVELKDLIFTNIKKDDESKAFTWFRRNDREDLIKNTIKAELGMKEDETALLIADFFRENEIPVEIKPSIHNATLKKFVNLELKAGRGKDLPDFLNIQEFKQTKITKKKGK